MQAAVPYQETSIATILTYASFLLLLNIVNWAVDGVLHCGLVGQILVGVAWGAPGGKLLSVEAQEVFVQIGYLGLILMVYEGGLHTAAAELKANLAISLGVATTGIAAPIALSFVLRPLLHASFLQCFTAGAALCSTSLGTTFAVLRASGLGETRLGVILTSAAMLDDIVGMVMVQVISSLGCPDAHVAAGEVVRPVLVAVAFVAVALLGGRFVVPYLIARWEKWRAVRPQSRMTAILGHRGAAFALHTGILLALVAGASYAGTSNLFAAYIAGALSSWADSCAARLRAQSQDYSSDASSRSSRPQHDLASSGREVFDRYYGTTLRRVLQPLFFASIGFSIPITRMFSGPTIWRGIIYAILMTFGKLLCGLWLIRIPISQLSAIKKGRRKGAERARPPKQKESAEKQPAGVDAQLPSGSSQEVLEVLASSQGVVAAIQHEQREQHLPNETKIRPAASTSSTDSPFSPNPPLILGWAMVARGEIGFLIAAVAQSSGIFYDKDDEQPDDDGSFLYLATLWAIVLCTVLGPVVLGFLVRRLRKLERMAGAAEATSDDGEHRTRRVAVLSNWSVR